MLVLVIAALCKCHPLPSSKLLTRVVAYIRTRLRDNEAAVTDACAILVSSIALHVLPLLAPLAETSKSTADSAAQASRDSSAWRSVFESVATPLLKDVNAVGESATKCVCALLHPTEFDGHALPSRESLAAHAKRVHVFFTVSVRAAVARLDSSTMYASFSATFLLLLAACAVARDAHKRAGVGALAAEVVPLVGSIVEAIEDVFQYGQRDDWVLRKRGMELLASLIEGFGLSPDAVAAPAVEYFRTHLVRESTDSERDIAMVSCGLTAVLRCLHLLGPRARPRRLWSTGSSLVRARGSECSSSGVHCAR